MIRKSEDLLTFLQQGGGMPNERRISRDRFRVVL